MENNIGGRTEEIFAADQLHLSIETDRIFAGLLVFQWLLAIVLALCVSPYSWEGSESRLNMHVYAALIFGGLIAALPVIMVLTQPGRYINRYVITLAQMAFSTLLIHVTNGRIETHFHIFGSLAFIAFYKDWRPLLLATVLTALDHLARGAYFPESIYGVLSATPYRALEHSAWVVFEDFFLVLAIQSGLRERKENAFHQAKLENTLNNVEKIVQNRTEELRSSQAIIIQQQEALSSSAKWSALGEMAGGVAHEINTPLAVINMRVEQLEESVQEKIHSDEEVLETLEIVRKTTQRIAQIVGGLRMIAREGRGTPFKEVCIHSLIEDTLSFCRERFKMHDVALTYEPMMSESLICQCRAVEISQVLLNLMNNAFDAISEFEERWVRVEIQNNENTIEISVTDCGQGIPEEIQAKLMQPFFTTKEIGKGTGLGLSISKGILLSHQGNLVLDKDSANTKFRIILPKKQASSVGSAA